MSGPVLSAMPRAGGPFRRAMSQIGRGLVRAGLPARWIGWRAIVREMPLAHGSSEAVRILQPATRAAAAPPRNVTSSDALSDDAGWWGFSRRDVLDRAVAPTCSVRIADATLVSFRGGARDNYLVGILDRRGRSVYLPQIKFGPRHAAMMRHGLPRRRIRRATWIAERCFDNHSHWLTAHLPKLLYLRDQGLPDDLAIPAPRPATIEASIRAIGLDPAAWTQIDTMTAVEVEELTVLTTDRFRPSLLDPVRRAHWPADGPPAPFRKVLVSRRAARGRRLIGEDALWPELRRRGFQRVTMEHLGYSAQVRLMQETAILVAPHGAGLTNMIFCAAGSHVVEIADPAYPNPNFYALAAAMGHQYWLIDARAVGDGHPLDRDLDIRPGAVTDVVDAIGDP